MRPVVALDRHRCGRTLEDALELGRLLVSRAPSNLLRGFEELLHLHRAATSEPWACVGGSSGRPPRSSEEAVSVEEALAQGGDSWEIQGGNPDGDGQDLRPAEDPNREGARTRLKLYIDAFWRPPRLRVPNRYTKEMMENWLTTRYGIIGERYSILDWREGTASSQTEPIKVNCY